MRTTVSLATITVLLVLIWIFLQSTRTMTNLSELHPKTEGQTLPLAHLAQSDRIVIVVTRSRWGSDSFEWQYQIEGGSTTHFAGKDLVRVNAGAIIAGTLTPDEMLGLEAYLLFLRRGFEGSGHGREDVIVGYYRDGRKVGEERFPNTMPIFANMRWENGRVSGPFGQSVSDFPIEVFREIIPPWVVVQRLSGRTRR